MVKLQVSRVRLPNWVSKPSLFTLTTSRCDVCASCRQLRSLANGVAAYLQSQKLVETAAAMRVTPFILAGASGEVSAFASTCEERGVLFIGPTAAQLSRLAANWRHAL